MRYINLLLIFVPLAIVGETLGWSPTLVFTASALGVIPLAGLIGEATEELAAHTGPRVGGLLNATLGNAAELIISLFAIRAGLLTLVKASIIGSILGNLLLVTGASVLLGGLRHGVQRFDRAQAGLNATMLILAVVAISVPSLFSHAIEPNHQAVEGLSLGVSGVMIAIYGMGLLYTLRAQPSDTVLREASHTPSWSVRRALIVLTAATAAIAWLSEVLVGSVEAVVAQLGWTEFFLGIIVIPIVGNVAEHLVAVQVALKDQMELSFSISLGSSLQIALFVAPLLVFVSLAMGNPLTLVFDQFELIAMVGSSLVVALVALDGESNWLEGAQLLAVYAILALAFFYLPAA